MPYAALIGMAVGMIQASQAKKGQDELAKMTKPELTETPEMASARARAEQAAGYGFSPEETASFTQRLARQRNTATQKGIDQGGQGAAINAAINYIEPEAWASFTEKSARIQQEKQRYADSFSKALQDMDNANNQQERAELNAAWDASGQLGAQGMQNIAGGAMTAAMGANKAGGTGASDPVKDPLYGRSTQTVAPIQPAASTATSGDVMQRNQPMASTLPVTSSGVYGPPTVNSDEWWLNAQAPMGLSSDPFAYRQPNMLNADPGSYAPGATYPYNMSSWIADPNQYRPR